MKKQAYLKMFGLDKKSGVGSQMTSAAIFGGTDRLLGFNTPLLALPGMAAKIINDKSSTKDYDESPVVGILPGVSSYRVQRRRNQIPAVIKAKKSQTGHELAGNLLTNISGSLAGLLAGKALAEYTGNTADTPLYGMGGAIVGATAPNLVAMLAALITKKRTLKEQKEYEESSPLKNYIPGVSTYNQLKNFGVLTGDQYKKAREQNYKKKTEKKDKKEA